MSFGNRRLSLFVIPLFLFLYSATNIARADLVLSAPPRETIERGKQLYGPLAEQLSAVIGENVVYEQPSGWFDYASKMRSGKYDIVFDGPHFTAWRLKHLKHVPVAVLPGSLVYYLFTSKSNTEINKPRDLVGQRICSMLSPFLGTDLVYEIFANPVLQPLIHEVKGAENVYKSFKRGECEAALMRDLLFRARIPAEERKNIKIIVKTEPLPNQTITVSKRLEANAGKIAKFLTSKDGALVADGILSRFSKRKKVFVPPEPVRYIGIERLLEGVVWGW